MTEKLKITKEIKYLDDIGEWCVGIQCFDKGFEIWTGGFFHKEMKKAEEMAMEALEKSVKAQRAMRKPADVTIEEVTL